MISLFIDTAPAIVINNTLCRGVLYKHTRTDIKYTQTQETKEKISILHKVLSHVKFEPSTENGEAELT